MGRNAINWASTQHYYIDTVITKEKIHLPPGASYCIQTNSKYFPNINVSDIIKECLEKARQINTSTAIRQLRQQFPAK
ncbi:hypothetical protein RIVM261_052430 [Rivularia sp. IAM M-261]|nr:hypothetical protein RIVM261_052430 [Rivularia sp. IAM M-261]